MSDPIRHADLVDGVLSEAELERDGILEDPDDGSPIGTERASAPAAIESALAAASSARAREGWSELSVEERCAAMEAFAVALDVRAETIAQVDRIDSGVPISVTRLMATSLAASVRTAIEVAREAGEGRRIERGGRRIELLRLPWGVAVVLTPWNAPAAAAIGKVANALLAGCPTILKPSEQAPSFSLHFAEAALEAGLPDSCFQVVHGGADVASSLVGDPRVGMIALIGGRPTGRAVAATAGPRMVPMQLELGGSNPALVTADADLEDTAASLAEGMTKLNGQWCEAPRRVIVPRELQDALADATREALERIAVGPAREEATEFGPLANRPHLERVRRQIAGLGGTVIETAEVPTTAGFFVSPTLVLDADRERAGEEIFGPVLSFLPCDGEDEALGVANSGEDGLAAYVFSGDRDRALALGRRLHAGEVRLGGTKLIDLTSGSTQSFWGSSGIGSHGARQVFEAFRGSRIVGDEDPTLPL